MAFKNYYVVLGVAQDESSTAIHSRYRDLAKLLHPDVAGHASTAAFQELNEAYRVLSDPEQRRLHNRALAGDQDTSRPIETPRAPRERATYLIDPGVGALFERIRRNYTGYRVPKGEHVECLNFEVLLTPDEAARGGDIPVTLPAFVPCPQCGGRGRDWLFVCMKCRGQGVREVERVVHVRIAPFSRASQVVEIPLTPLGIDNLFLRLHISVSNDA